MLAIAVLLTKLAYRRCLNRDLQKVLPKITLGTHSSYRSPRLLVLLICRSSRDASQPLKTLSHDMPASRSGIVTYLDTRTERPSLPVLLISSAAPVRPADLARACNTSGSSCAYQPIYPYILMQNMRSRTRPACPPTPEA